jgi:uncharacterized membrane protein
MVLLLIAYPLLSHLAALTHNQSLAALALGVFVAVPLTGALRRGRPWAWLALLASLAVLWTVARTGHALTLMYLPPILIPASVLAVFAGSLRAGRTPVVEQVATQIRGSALPMELQSYCRRVTQVWVLFLGGLATAALLLALFASPGLWSTMTNGVLYLLIGLLFVGEYLYRRWRFRDLPHESFPRFVAGLFTSRVR